MYHKLYMLELVEASMFLNLNGSMIPNNATNFTKSLIWDTWIPSRPKLPNDSHNSDNNENVEDDDDDDDDDNDNGDEDDDLFLELVKSEEADYT